MGLQKCSPAERAAGEVEVSKMPPVLACIVSEPVKIAVAKSLNSGPKK